MSVVISSFAGARRRTLWNYSASVSDVLSSSSLCCFGGCVCLDIVRARALHGDSDVRACASHV